MAALFGLEKQEVVRIKVKVGIVLIALFPSRNAVAELLVLVFAGQSNANELCLQWSAIRVCVLTIFVIHLLYQ